MLPHRREPHRSRGDTTFVGVSVVAPEMSSLRRRSESTRSGLGRFDRTWLYVSRGTGTWGPPLRTGVPAEITELELVAG